MADGLLDDIVRLRRQLADAEKEHGYGKDVGAQLASIGDELGHLLERTEARLDEMDAAGIDQRTRFVSELAGRLLCAVMAQRDSAVTESQLEQAVDMASEIVRRVEVRA